MSVKAELDRKVISILGEDHPISKQVEEYDDELEITTVLFAVFCNLSDRLEALETKMDGRN